MKIRTKFGVFDTHPAADVFPMMVKDKLEELAEDIKREGLREDLWMLGKLLLDGRNRLTACELANVRPRFQQYTGKDPIGFVVSMNLARRHLDDAQRTWVAAKIATMRKGSNQHPPHGGPSISKGKAAKLLNVRQRGVERMAVVVSNGVPELEALLARGDIDTAGAARIAQQPKAAQRELIKKLDRGEGKKIRNGHVDAIVRREHKIEVARKINEQRLPMPLGPYRVIASDPPWKFDNSDGHLGSRGHTPYPPMTTDAICALAPEVLKLAHDDGCVLWLWTTNFHLAAGDSARVVREWGFKPITIFTWKKNKLGLGSWLRNQTEHAILAVRGPAIVTLDNEPTWIEADVREHSRKPDLFYEIVERLCPGDKIEMFAQTPRPGWVRWGAESEKYAAAG